MGARLLHRSIPHGSLESVQCGRVVPCTAAVCRRSSGDGRELEFADHRHAPRSYVRQLTQFEWHTGTDNHEVCTLECLRRMCTKLDAHTLTAQPRRAVQISIPTGRGWESVFDSRYQIAGDQRCGSSSAMRLAGSVGSRSSTSLGASAAHRDVGDDGPAWRLTWCPPNSFGGHHPGRRLPGFQGELAGRIRRLLL